MHVGERVEQLHEQLDSFRERQLTRGVAERLRVF